jgi:hypothetical protein
MRKIVAWMLVVLLCVFAFVLYHLKVNPPVDSSLSTMYEVLSRPLQTTDVLLARAVPVNNVDEKEYGEAIARVMS